MALEMVGARVLWNDFGSSVFVWGSIISVFMAALALGYYFGGRLADRRPSMAWLSGIVGAAGLLVLVVSHCGLRVTGALDAKDLGPRAGPLAASMVLYFPPSLLLGAVSPFAVRLSARRLASMGNVAGRLYALSTLGSLAGTLLTTFVLIPAMGTTRILYGIGLILLAAAILGLAARFAAHGRPSAGGTAAALLFLLTASAFGYGLNPAGPPGALAPQMGLRLSGNETLEPVVIGGREYETAYHNIAIIGWFDATRHGRSRDASGKLVRDARGAVVVDPAKGLKEDPDAILEMRFNNVTQSTLYCNREGHPPKTTYTRLLHMGMALNPNATRVLIVGLGGGSTPREFVEMYTDRALSVDVVEVDGKVAELSRAHFHHADSPDPSRGVRTYIGDGRQFIRRGQGRHARYDLIVLDAYSGGGSIPAHLVTREFLEQVRGRLAEGGLLVSNVIAALEGPKSRFFFAEYRTLAAVFSQIYVFPTWLESPQITRNLIMIAPRDPGPRLAPEALVAAASRLLERYPKLRERTASTLYNAKDLAEFAGRAVTVKDADLANAPLLTDEYAPVETMFYWIHRED
jgi:spermidine synthase